MATNSLNLTLGPARVYLAPYPTAMPPAQDVTPNGPSNPPSDPWTEVGFTNGGVTFAANGTLTNLEADQVIMPVGARLTALEMTVETTMAEVTIGNMNSALNSIMTSQTGTGYESADITVTGAATQPNYTAIVLDGWAPSLSSGQSALRRIYVAKALATPKVSLAYNKKDQAGYAVTWNVFYVADGVDPVTITDQTA